MKRPLVLLQVLSFVFSATGCATIISGTHQQVQLEVYPPGTQIAVYRWSGELVAGPEVSPGRMKVRRPVRGRPYLVRASKDGHCPQYWLTSSTTSAGGKLDMLMAFAGIIVLAPLIVAVGSVLVDTNTGGYFAMESEHFGGYLQEDKVCAQ